MKPIQLAIVEDDTLVRESLQEYLGAQPDIQIVRSAQSLEEFFHYLPSMGPVDMMLLDIGLPGMSGLEGIEIIKEKRPEIDIVMLTAFEDYDRIYQALCSGAVSYLSKRTRLPVIKEALLNVRGRPIIRSCAAWRCRRMASSCWAGPSRPFVRTMVR